MSLVGKGFYIWKISRCEGGDVQAIATVAAQAGLTHILVKIADGTPTCSICGPACPTPPSP